MEPRPASTLFIPSVKRTKAAVPGPNPIRVMSSQDLGDAEAILAKTVGKLPVVKDKKRISCKAPVSIIQKFSSMGPYFLPTLL